MKKLFIYALFMMTEAIQCMDQENWQTVEPWLRTSVFQELINNLSIAHQWETIDDQTATTLRALHRTLYSSLQQHRTQKIAMHKQWIIDNTNPDSERARFHQSVLLKPTIIIENGTLTCTLGQSNIYLVRKGKKKKLGALSCKTLLPHSLVVGPSGNSVCYSVIGRKDPYTTEGIEFWERYRFKVYNDGSISLENKEILDYSSDTNTPTSDVVHNTDRDGAPGYFRCYTDENHTKLMSMETITINDTQETSHIVYSSWKNTVIDYTHTHPSIRHPMNTPHFLHNSISIYLSINYANTPYYLVYRYDANLMPITCTEHVVGLDDSTTVSMALFPSRLQNYLLTCSGTELNARNPHIIPSPPQVVHTFEPNEIYPLELFERHTALIPYKQIKQTQKTDTCQKDPIKVYLKTVPLEEHMRYYMVNFLLTDNTFDKTLATRLRTRGTNNTALWYDMYGELSYATEQHKRGIGLDYTFFKYPSIPELWLRLLVPIGPLPHDATKALCNNPAFALACSSKALIEAIQQELYTLTQQTWNNGTIGAAWAFTKDGMHIRLYHLKHAYDQSRDHPVKHFNIIKGYSTLDEYKPIPGSFSSSRRIIDDYQLAGITKGTITNVIYTEGAQPIFYVDGDEIQL